MNKIKAIDLDELQERVVDLLQQARTEKSHHYTAKTLTDCAMALTALRLKVIFAENMMGKFQSMKANGFPAKDWASQVEKEIEFYETQTKNL